MKKKLLSVVLSVVMLASLLVPMVAINAEGAPTATISLGTPELVEDRDFDGDGTPDGTFIAVPIEISDNTGAFYVGRYQVLSNEGLAPHYKVYEAGTENEYADEGVDNGDFKRKQGNKYIELNVTVGRDPEGTDKTGYQILQDSNGGASGITTASGTLAIAYFVAPTAGGDYTFELVWMDGTDNNNPPVNYDMTVGVPTVTFTVVGKECAHAETEEVVVDATCTEKGSKSVKCKECGATISSEEIAALGHTDGEPVRVEPTCTEKGSVTVKCTVCGETTSSEEIAALGHTDGEPVRVEPSCADKGSVTVKCTVCGETVSSEEIDALGHSYGVVADHAEAKAPTCTEKGVEVSVCSKCNDVKKVEVAALGHTEGQAEQTKAPTCTEKGEKVTKCTVCDEVLKTEEIAALGHTDGEAVRVEPTCTEKGSVTVKCTVCGETVSSEEIDALGHDYGDKKVVEKPTADKEGKWEQVCSRCDDKKEGTIAKLATSFEDKDAGISIKSETAVLPEDIEMVLDESTAKEEDGKYFINFKFNSQVLGALSGKADFELSLEDTDEMDNIEIAVLNADGTTTVVSQIKDGKLVFSANLEDTYVLSFTEKTVVEDKEDDKTPETPKTGDTMNVALVVIAALVAVAGLAVVGKKRMAL
ncbi:MAG: LPXTG cell wall anchor domain-containing protein [Acutalibacteraceae bacterium]|nr:LPXTG cell wall anchor domain-containing protein [Acutalibacteraceae bacterium]